jgi:hypothetical protein
VAVTSRPPPQDPAAETLAAPPAIEDPLAPVPRTSRGRSAAIARHQALAELILAEALDRVRRGEPAGTVARALFEDLIAADLIRTTTAAWALSEFWVRVEDAGGGGGRRG